MTEKAYKNTALVLALHRHEMSPQVHDALVRDFANFYASRDPTFRRDVFDKRAREWTREDVWHFRHGTAAFPEAA